MSVTQERINIEAANWLSDANTSGQPLAELSGRASALALALFQCETLNCTDGRLAERCLEKETKRLKGYPQLPAHSTNRSWSYFDPQKLCNHCRPYGYAEMAAMEMRACAHFEAVLQEEAKHKSAKGK